MSAIFITNGDVNVKQIFKSPAWTAVLAVLCNMLWGSAYPGVKLGYEAFGVTDTPQKLLFAGLRFLIAGAIVLTVSIPISKRTPKLTKKNAPMILLTALIYTTVQYVFFYIGLSNTTGTNGSIVNSTTTFMAVILSHFVYKNDKITAPRLIGTCIGFAGVLVVCFGGSVSFSLTGEGFILIAALCFVIGSMLSKHASSSSDAFTVTGFNLLFGGALLTLLGLAFGGRLTAVTPVGIANLLYLALLSSAAFTIWTILLKYNSIASISVYNFIIPVFGTLLSALLLNENILESKYLVSLILVSAGIIIVNTGATKRHSLKTGGEK